VAGSGLSHADWLAHVPDLLTDCRREWGLRLGEAYAPGAAGYAVRADLHDKTPVVLKLIYPHRESEHEAEALRVWDGDGAVRLLAYDATRWAMLLERCEPGTYLSALGQDAALDVMVELLPRLWKPASAPPFRTLSEEAAWWCEIMPGEPALRDAAIGVVRELADSQGEQVLQHQDLHADNVLRAEREPWLVIDPKPLAGEREFGIAALVRGGELGDGVRNIRHRLDRLTSELGLDRERAWGWALGQTLAWENVEQARWLLQARP
jgi:streptomycin 6-kinase